MTIAELAAQSKAYLERIPRSALFIAIIALSSSAAFGLGILEGREAGGGGVNIEQLGTTIPSMLQASVSAASTAPAASSTIPAGGEVVASKSGTKYYLPWCGSVKLIKDENKVWFATREAAEAAGYQPASNCKGL